MWQFLDDRKPTSRIMEYTAVNKIIIILNRGHGCEYFQDAAEYTNLWTATLASED
jgi:hypothetical protein